MILVYNYSHPSSPPDLNTDTIFDNDFSLAGYTPWETETFKIDARGRLTMSLTYFNNSVGHE